MEQAYLILEDGTVFEGQHFGAAGEAQGELVFTTGMTGCSESLTDPSFWGQIVLYTFPQLANCGINSADQESAACHMRGVVVREHCQTPSNFRCEMTADAFLKQEQVVGIAGIDTRALTQKLRDRGVMGARITTNAPTPPDDFRIQGAVCATSTKEAYTLLPDGEVRHTVALLDYGAKKSISRSLLSRGCKLLVFPHDTAAEVILAAAPDGLMLSNGPGDPSENTYAIAQLQKLMGKLPLFGICLGHQMLALANGAKTKKMKFGHRGANQPVKDLKNGRIYITSQNHGYAVDADSLAGTGGQLRYVNANDGSCEGVEYSALQAFSLQYHPEAHNGPLDCVTAFDDFVAMMEGN